VKSYYAILLFLFFTVFSSLEAIGQCTNVALGKPATTNSGSAYFQNVPSRAVDGDCNNPWNAGGYATRWVQVDLQGTYTINNINLTVIMSPNGNCTHTIYTAPNTGGPWTAVDVIAGNRVNFEKPERCYSAAPLTGVGAVRVTTTTSPSWVAWAEIGVFTLSPPSTPSITATSPLTFCQGDSTTLTAPSGISYSWSPGGQVTQSIVVTTSGTYSVTLGTSCITGASSNTCTACPGGTATVSVTVAPNPTVTITGLTSICNGTSNSLTASGGDTYSWNTGASSTSITISPTAATAYTVTGTAANGCTAIGSKTVTLNNPPAVTLSAQTNVSCYGGNNGDAGITASGGGPAYTYAWNPSGGNSSAATGLSSGNYTATITDANGCTNTQSVIITEPPVLSSTTAATNPNCNGGTGSATISASGGTSGYTYAWSPSGGTSSTATGFSPGSYTTTVTDANGCTKTSTFSITQPTVLTSSASSTNPACNGATGNANVTAGGGTPSYTYAWTPSGGAASSATGLSQGNYTATVTDARGCTKTSTVSITQPTAITISVTASSTSCGNNNGAAVAAASSGTSPYTYTWNTGKTTQTITGLAAGTYTVTVKDGNGCTRTQTVSVNGISGPTATASANNLTIPLGSSTTLTAGGNGTYAWSPASGLSCISCASPVATPSSTTSYCVLVSDANGCTDSDCITIDVEIPCGEVFIPSAFSPNNDGNNDWVCIRGNCILKQRFIIYNRWGEKVFETTDSKICWDGSYNDKPVNTGSFVYLLEATLTSGEEIIKKGSISLVR